MRVVKMLLALAMVMMPASTTAAGTPMKDEGGSADSAISQSDSLTFKQAEIEVQESLPRCALVARDGFALKDVPARSVNLFPDSSLEENPALSGDLYQDLLSLEVDSGVFGNGLAGSDGRRSPALAFGMSAAIPGLGQAYNKSWLRAAVAGALEIGLWTGYFTWRGQGRDGEVAYQAFADRDWSAYRYGAWLNEYPGYLGADLDISSIEDVDFSNPAGWSVDQQLRVGAFFEDLRTAERISHYNNADGTGTGATFSHVLPDHGDQQYYELIGKYYQYGAGWSDWCDGRDPSDASCFTIEGFDQREVFAQKTSLFFDYATDHADANSLLRRASRITSVIVANHALAALDALLTARYHNRGLELESSLSLRQGPDGAVSPVANVRLTF